MGCLLSVLSISGCTTTTNWSQEARLNSWMAQENAAYALYQEGRLSDALDKFVLVASIARDNKLGAAYEAISLTDLAQVCMAMKSYKNAQDFYNKAADLYQHQIGMNGDSGAKLELARTYSNLAVAHQLAGEVQDADQLFRQALSALPQAKPDSDEPIDQVKQTILQKYSSYLNNRVSVESNPLVKQQAEQIASELAKIPSIQGDLPSNNMKSELQKKLDATNQALERGQKDQVVKLLASTVSYAKSLPQSDSELTGNLENLVKICFGSGDWPDCEFFCRHLLSYKEKEFGTGNVELISILNMLAQVCYLQQKYPDAEQLWKEVLSIQSSQKTTKPAEVVQTMLRIAQTYSDRGMWSEATFIIEKSIKVLELSQDPDADLHAHAVQLLAKARIGAGDYKEGELLFTRAVSEFERTQGKNSREVADVLVALGDIHVQQDKLDLGRQEYLRMLSIRKQVFGDKDIIYKDRLESLAKKYYEKGQWSKAAGLYKSFMDQVDKSGVPLTAQFGQDLLALANCYTHLGEPKKAKETYQRTLSACEREFGTNDPVVSMCKLKLNTPKAKQAETHKSSAIPDKLP